VSGSVSTIAPRARRLPKAVALTAVLLAAAGFVLKYVFHYYLNYNAAGFDPYCGRRSWLLVHITSGMAAILIGPWQFSRRIRQRHLQLHRFMGRTYLIAVACGSMAGFYLAVTTTFGWAWAAGLPAWRWPERLLPAWPSWPSSSGRFKFIASGWSAATS